MNPLIKHLIYTASMLLEKLHREGSYRAEGKSVLRLDDVLQFREPAEDRGSILAQVYSFQSKPLTPRLASPVRLRRKVLHVGIDSSSRKLDTPIATLIIGAASASSTDKVELLDIPPLYNQQSWDGWEWNRFMIMIPSLGDGQVNPAGYRYGEDYSEAQAMDELRVSLENRVADIIAGYYASKARPERVIAVLLDGPLFIVPGALLEPGAPVEYRDSWERLLRDRLSIINRLEDLGVPVIGVVKRVERSRILVRADGFLERAAGCLDSVLGGDRMMLYLIYRKCVKPSPGRLYATPRIRVSYPRNGLDKIVEYVMVPPGMWQSMPELAKVYRLEYTKRTIEILDDYGLQPHHIFSLDSIKRGSLSPVTIQLSDRRAKMITLTLKRLIAAEVLYRRIPLSYDTLIEVEADWRRRQRAAV